MVFISNKLVKHLSLLEAARKFEKIHGVMPTWYEAARAHPPQSGLVLRKNKYWRKLEAKEERLKPENRLLKKYLKAFPETKKPEDVEEYSQTGKYRAEIFVQAQIRLMQSGKSEEESFELLSKEWQGERYKTNRSYLDLHTQARVAKLKSASAVLGEWQQLDEWYAEKNMEETNELQAKFEDQQEKRRLSLQSTSHSYLQSDSRPSFARLMPPRVKMPLGPSAPLAPPRTPTVGAGSGWSPGAGGGWAQGGTAGGAGVAPGGGWRGSAAGVARPPPPPPSAAPPSDATKPNES